MAVPPMGGETDGFLVCGVHGDIYWQPSIRTGEEVSPSAVQAVHPDAPEARSGKEILCFCGLPLHPELRAACAASVRVRPVGLVALQPFTLGGAN